MTLSVAELAEQARRAVGSDGAVIGSSEPRFALFHAANSICSQKVRAVLAWHGMAYLSHPMNLFTGQTYLPEYVRLRMIGCTAHGGALVARHSGSTSAGEGCDGVVVPTLVDFQANAVLVDSKAICLSLDALAPSATRLRPEPLVAAIDRELDLVDSLPNYQLLMARRADPAAFSLRKVAWCERFLAQCADEPVLVAAYAAKREKERSAADALFSKHAISEAVAKTEAALGALEGRLQHSVGGLLFQQRPTLADLFWAIELLRLDNLGFGHLWADGCLPSTAALLEAAREWPALRSSIIDWPGALY